MSETIRDAVKHGHDVSVCRDCAIAAGAEWPSGHVATQWTGECRGCGRTTGCCSTTDWQWPGKAGRLMRARREI